MSVSGGVDGHSLQASYPGLGCGGAGKSPCHGSRTLEAGSTRSALGGPVGSPD